ncbi:MAG: hypothetical protein ACOZDY_11015 [Pseudomonadota bacterium]
MKFMDKASYDERAALFERALRELENMPRPTPGELQAALMGGVGMTWGRLTPDERYVLVGVAAALSRFGADYEAEIDRYLSAAGKTTQNLIERRGREPTGD